MSDNSIFFKGLSLSINFLKSSNLDLKRVHNTLKEFQFIQKRKFGIQELRQAKNYIQFNYIELLPKNIEVFENGEIVFKTLFLPKYSLIFLFQNNSIFIGSSKFNRRAINKLKNLINIEFRPILKSNTQMLKIYHDFFKVFQLNLIENDKDAPIKNLRLKGELSEDTYWEEYSSNRFLSEIYGKFEIDNIIYNLKIKSNCACIIYKSGESFPIDSLIWLRDYIKNNQ